MASPRVVALTGATPQATAAVCQSCIWWQTRGNREPDKRKWIERAESEWGVWGSIYRDEDGRVLGSLQYGPAQLFPRAEDLPAGPPSADAALVTCAYRYREGTATSERFLVHRTVFPRDFLADFGFRTVRSVGRIELARLDFGGLQPVEEGTREKVLNAVRDAFQPAPARLPP